MCKNAILFVSAITAKKFQTNYTRKVEKGLSGECAEMKPIFIFTKQNDVDLHHANGAVIQKVVFDLEILNYESRIIEKVKKYILENNRGIVPQFFIINRGKDHRFGCTSIQSVKEMSNYKNNKQTQAMSA